MLVEKALPFIRESQREDGSWPIDRDLENFDTTQALYAYYEAGRPVPQEDKVRSWLLENQSREPCFHTSAAPGGWAWAQPDGWPDMDDTACTLRSLRLLGLPQPLHGLFYGPPTHGAPPPRDRREMVLQDREAQDRREGDGDGPPYPHREHRHLGW